MKIIDHEGRLFGKISVIDLLVVAVVIVLAAALRFKSGQAITGTSVPEETIVFQVQLYDLNYASGGRSLGEVTEIQVVREPGTLVAALDDGTAGPVEVEDSVNLLLTVKGSGLVNGKSRTINRVYDLGLNASRTFYTDLAQFTGTISNIF